MTRFCGPPTCLTGSKGLALDTAARSKPPASCRVYPVQLWKERATGQQPDSSCNPQRCLPISPQCYMRSCRSRGFTQLHARVSNDLIDHDAPSCSSKSGVEGSQRDVCGLFSPDVPSSRLLFCSPIARPALRPVFFGTRVALCLPEALRTCFCHPSNHSSRQAFVCGMPKLQTLSLRPDHSGFRSSQRCRPCRPCRPSSVSDLKRSSVAIPTAFLCPSTQDCTIFVPGVFESSCHDVVHP